MQRARRTRRGRRPASCDGNGSCSSELCLASIWNHTCTITTLTVRLQHLIRQHSQDIAKSIVLEQGKTFADAQGDVGRGLQVVESATAITSNLLGDKLEVSSDMDTYSRRLPLGVTAAITPFNFPAMIVLWSAALATVTGELRGSPRALSTKKLLRPELIYEATPSS